MLEEAFIEMLHAFLPQQPRIALIYTNLQSSQRILAFYATLEQLPKKINLIKNIILPDLVHILGEFGMNYEAANVDVEEMHVQLFEDWRQILGEERIYQVVRTDVAELFAFTQIYLKLVLIAARDEVSGSSGQVVVDLFEPLESIFFILAFLDELPKGKFT